VPLHDTRGAAPTAPVAVFHESRSAYSTPDRKLISLSKAVLRSAIAHTVIQESVSGAQNASSIKATYRGSFGGRSIDFFLLGYTDTNMSGERIFRIR
jgi:hypothetical protein